MGFLDKQLDKQIPVPLYYQLKTLLEDYIEHEHADYDKPIPTEMEISQAFDISRPTVRQAINALVVEGKLYRKKSKGTFIAKPKIDQHFLESIQSFNDEMREKGLTPSTEVVDFSVIPCDEIISKRLTLPPECDVIRLVRRRFAADEPIVYVVSFLPYTLCQQMLQYDFTKESMYHVLEEKIGLKIDYALRRLEAKTADRRIAETLCIQEGDAVQYIETIAYLDDGTPFEFSMAHYRGDRSHFTYKLKNRS